ncbi:cytochrome c553 [Rhodopirellula rubra]|uniref:Cytochrome c553 n=1 Tax=Aporhodopirellula rubra TaxID=980271 RepID=A0A7W5E056_9BACT|nr:di-heme oxidoredictase family protein [Aporhodopirellula rubra]MBB3207364.1 cytochrome c553 [Aporhodopirellula rubra]
MAAKHRYELAGLLIFSLVFATHVIAQDAVAGRELFEREWEFVDRGAGFGEWEPMLRMPHGRERGHGRGMERGMERGKDRGPRPERGGNERGWGSAIAGDGAGFVAQDQGFADDGQELAPDGLGPLHNAVSCAACHPGGGASGVSHNVTRLTVDPRSPFFEQPMERGGRGGRDRSVTELFPGLVSGNELSFKTIVHDRSTRPGYDVIRQRLLLGVPNGLSPEWFSPDVRTVEAIAMQPVVAGRYRTLDYYLSQRNTTPLHGMGEIERISINRLNAVSLSQNRLSGGVVSGRVAGKYGWRGQVSTLSDFVVGACATELGLNVPGIAKQADDPADPRYVNSAPDISTAQIADLTSYVGGLPAPKKALLSLDERKRVRRGEQVFHSTGCAVCHVADLLPARGIYSDLLLHDMGAELQDPSPAPAYEQAGTRAAIYDGLSRNQYGRDATSHYRSGRRPDRGRSAQRESDSIVLASAPQTIAMDDPVEPQFPRGEISDADLQGRYRFSWDALQREWKTPPLWGVADSAPYLHDGRAETLTDAIQWHGGEAETSKRRFLNLNKDQQQLLLAFLGSLKSPLE